MQCRLGKLCFWWSSSRVVLLDFPSWSDTKNNYTRLTRVTFFLHITSKFPHYSTGNETSSGQFDDSLLMCSKGRKKKMPLTVCGVVGVQKYSGQQATATTTCSSEVVAAMAAACRASTLFGERCARGGGRIQRLQPLVNTCILFSPRLWVQLQRLLQFCEEVQQMRCNAGC